MDTTEADAAFEAWWDGPASPELRALQNEVGNQRPNANQASRLLRLAFTQGYLARRDARVLASKPQDPAHDH